MVSIILCTFSVSDLCTISGQSQMSPDSLLPPYAGTSSSSLPLQALDVLVPSSGGRLQPDPMDELMMRGAVAGCVGPVATCPTPTIGCVLNPIDKLYSMQTSYFNCVD
jgi:hypothetical protein